MKQVLKFCVEYNLMDQETADRLFFMHERRWEHPIRLVLQNMGLDYENKFFQAASENFQIPMLAYDAVDLSKKYTHIMNKKDQEYFNCIIVSEKGDIIQVVTWNFYKKEIIPHALNQLTGKTVKLYLMTCSEFDQLAGVMLQ